MCKIGRDLEADSCSWTTKNKKGKVLQKAILGLSCSFFQNCPPCSRRLSMLFNTYPSNSLDFHGKLSFPYVHCRKSLRMTLGGRAVSLVVIGSICKYGQKEACSRPPQPPKKGCEARKPSRACFPELRASEQQPGSCTREEASDVTWPQGCFVY